MKLKYVIFYGFVILAVISSIILVEAPGFIRTFNTDTKTSTLSFAGVWLANVSLLENYCNSPIRCSAKLNVTLSNDITLPAFSDSDYNIAFKNKDGGFANFNITSSYLNMIVYNKSHQYISLKLIEVYENHTTYPLAYSNGTTCQSMGFESHNSTNCKNTIQNSLWAANGSIIETEILPPHIEPIWGNTLKKGSNLIYIDATRKPNALVDWVIKFLGVDIPELAWWNASWQTRYNYTFLVNNSRSVNASISSGWNDQYFNVTLKGITASNCTKEVRITTDTDTELNSWSYGDETNGTGRNCILEFLANQTTLTREYWIYSNNPSADVPTYTNPFTCFGLTGLGTAFGSCDNGAGFNVTYGMSYQAGNFLTSAIGAMSMVPKINGQILLNPDAPNEGRLYELKATSWGTLRWNITRSSPIVTEISGWATTGAGVGYIRTYLYRNIPQMDLVFVNYTTTAAWMTGDSYNEIQLWTPGTPTTNYYMADSIGYSTAYADISPAPKSYLGMTSVTAGYPYYFTIIQDMVTFKNGLSGHGGGTGCGPGYNCAYVGLATAPLGAPIGGYKSRFVIMNDTGNLRDDVKNFYGVANVENATFWNPPRIFGEGTGAQGNNAAPVIHNINITSNGGQNGGSPFFGYDDLVVQVQSTDDSGVTSLSMNWTPPNATLSAYKVWDQSNMTQTTNATLWYSNSSNPFSNLNHATPKIDQFGNWTVNVTACDSSNLCVSKQASFMIFTQLFESGMWYNSNDTESITASIIANANNRIITIIGEYIGLRFNFTTGNNTANPNAVLTPLGINGTGVINVGSGPNYTIFSPNGSVAINGADWATTATAVWLDSSADVSKLVWQTSPFRPDVNGTYTIVVSTRTKTTGRIADFNSTITQNYTFNVIDDKLIRNCRQIVETGYYTLLRNITKYLPDSTNCIDIRSSNVTLNGNENNLTLFGDSTYGINIPAAARTNITIGNVRIKMNGTATTIGILITGSNITVSNNTINMTGTLSFGIYTSNYPTNLTILNNSILMYGSSSTSTIGLVFGVSNTSIVKSNNITVINSISSAIEVASSHKNEISYNNITATGTTNGIIIDYLYMQPNENSTFNTLVNNSIYLNGAGYGIYLLNGPALNNITLGYTKSMYGYDVFLDPQDTSSGGQSKGNELQQGTTIFFASQNTQLKIGQKSFATRTTPAFSYSNSPPPQDILLKTNISGVGDYALLVNLSRQIYSWNINLTKWNETYKEHNAAYQGLVSYNSSGLTPSWQYSFIRKNSTASSKTGYMSYSNGILPTVQTVLSNSDTSNMSIVKDTEAPYNITSSLQNPSCTVSDTGLQIKRMNESVVVEFNFIETGIISAPSSICNMTDSDGEMSTTNPTFYSNPDIMNPDNYTYSCSFSNVGSLAGFATVRATFNSTMNYSSTEASIGIRIASDCLVQGSSPSMSQLVSPRGVEKCYRDEECLQFGVGKLCNLGTNKCEDKTIFKFYLQPTAIITNPKVSTILPGGAPYSQPILIINDELRYTFTPQAKFECGTEKGICLNEYCTFTSSGTINPQTQGALTLTCAFPGTKSFPDKLYGNLNIYPKEFPLSGKTLPVTLVLSKSESQKQPILSLAEKVAEVSNRDITVSLFGKEETFKAGPTVAISVLFLLIAMMMAL